MNILKIQLALKIVIIIGLTIAGVWFVSTHEGPIDGLVLIGCAFIGILLLAVVSILETVNEILKEKLKEK